MFLWLFEGLGLVLTELFGEYRDYLRWQLVVSGDRG